MLKRIFQRDSRRNRQGWTWQYRRS